MLALLSESPVEFYWAMPIDELDRWTEAIVKVAERGEES
jgi:hypothetical protein